MEEQKHQDNRPRTFEEAQHEAYLASAQLGDAVVKAMVEALCPFVERVQKVIRGEQL